MNIAVTLSKNEAKALRTLLEENPCEHGCVWDICEKHLRELKSESAQLHYCDRCSFTKARITLMQKIYPDEYGNR